MGMQPSRHLQTRKRIRTFMQSRAKRICMLMQSGAKCICTLMQSGAKRMLAVFPDPKKAAQLMVQHMALKPHGLET